MLRLTNPTEALNRLRANIGAIEWAACPSCKSEWSKLVACAYTQFDKTEHGGFHKRADVTHLCPECAETIKGLLWCADQWPAQRPEGWGYDWIKVVTFWPDHAQRYDEVDAIDPDNGSTYKEQMWRWALYRARVKVWCGTSAGKPAVEFFVGTGRHTKIQVRRAGDREFEANFDSTVSAWHWLRSKASSLAMEVPALPKLGGPRGKFQKL